MGGRGGESVRLEILKTLAVLHPDHDIVEVRTKWASGNTMVGRTRSHEAIAEWASFCGGEPSIFITINRLPAGMVESPLNGNAWEVGGGVKNEYVSAIRWLHVDVDALREDSHRPASDAEIQEATGRAKLVIQFLYSHGFPQAVIAFSGNGWHLLYRTSMENTPKSAWLVRSFTKILHDHYKTDGQSHGASQVLRLYGAVNPKGGRQSKLEYVPEPLEEAKPDALEAMVASYGLVFKTRSKKQRQASDDKVEQFLEHCDLDAESEDYQGGTKWVMNECPLCGYEKPGVAVIGRRAEGNLWFHCLHEPTCGDVGWKEFREQMEEEHGKFSFEEDSVQSKIQVEDF
jgi:hypothetical protein